MEHSDPKSFPAAERPTLIREYNDILQGRSEKTPEELFFEIEGKAAPYYTRAIEESRNHYEDFRAQRIKRNAPYTKAPGEDGTYTYYDLDPNRPRKIITQAAFDKAARNGFPINFFKDSYFDGVTIYCVPDWWVCSGSIFQSCTFAVCRLHGLSFTDSSIYSSEFHSCGLKDVSFYGTTFASTHFRDCRMSDISFNLARMKSCNTIDCVMEHISFSGAKLDGCSYDRVTPSDIRFLSNTIITEGGATEEECRRNRDAILQALLPKPTPPVKKEGKSRGSR